MTKVTVTLFGDKEIDVEPDEVENLRSQGILTSVDGEAEEPGAIKVDESILPAAKLESAGAPAKEAKSGGSEKAPASK
jgi:hypothetical protein